jgi:hypothetical protein
MKISLFVLAGMISGSSAINCQQFYKDPKGCSAHQDQCKWLGYGGNKGICINRSSPEDPKCSPSDCAACLNVVSCTRMTPSCYWSGTTILGPVIGTCMQVIPHASSFVSMEEDEDGEEDYAVTSSAKHDDDIYFFDDNLFEPDDNVDASGSDDNDASDNKKYLRAN